MTDVLDTLVLFWPAFVASLVVALACALVGVHVVARRLIVVGVALPQVAALGIAASFLCEGWFLLGDHDVAALVCEGAAVAVLAFGARRTKLGQDALAGVLFVGAAAGTILLMQRSAAGLDEVRNLVEGNVLAIHDTDLPAVLGTIGAVVIVHLVALRRVLLVTFDRETAATLGIRTGVWDAVFYAGLAVVAATGVHATGTLFVFGFLVLPAAAAIVLGRSTAGVFGIATGVALGSAAVGFLLSCHWDTPTGPTCAVTALAAFLVALGIGAVRR